MFFFQKLVIWGVTSHIAQGSDPYITRPFGSSLASSSVRTLKLSENKARALPGWVTHWEVACEFPKKKP
ncbi:hypothetical protein DVH24_021377 [Malus domestica]|uniref:Secreted protein n=1 Tax=Malus domestica TaxID=3750 RepID=A0A498JWL6_MALDO|nr:hypothetical protein DVH24_021377 [Malus domestica]